MFSFKRGHWSWEWAWWLVSVMPALRRLKQEDCQKFKVIKGGVVRSCLRERRRSIKLFPRYRTEGRKGQSLWSPTEMGMVLRHWIWRIEGGWRSTLCLVVALAYLILWYMCLLDSQRIPSGIYFVSEGKEWLGVGMLKDLCNQWEMSQWWGSSRTVGKLG